MTLVIREVKDRKDLRTFIHLPEKVHADHPKWVPPILMDEWNYFRKDKNKAFDYCDTLLLLAFRGPECVGRVMGIINSGTMNTGTRRRPASASWRRGRIRRSCMLFSAGSKSGRGPGE